MLWSRYNLKCSMGRSNKSDNILVLMWLGILSFLILPPKTPALASHKQSPN